MNIVYLSSEAVPFAKTGGLADVCGTLPSRVAAMGHRTAVIMPAFRSVRRAEVEVETTDDSFAVSMSPNKLVGCRLLTGRLPEGDVPVWFLDQPQYFDRDSLYGTPDGDYPDNAERFAFFCRAALLAIERIGWSVDIVHCNDWQSGLVPALMAAQQRRWMRKAATIFTIHNLAYQGQFSKDAFRWTGLDWKHFNHNEFEYYDQLNYLKTGIVTADAVTTVSPRYSEEIRTQNHGCGLDGVLESVTDRLTGITNGIDRNIWNPSSDKKLTAKYDVDNWREGKQLNKAAIQQRYDLEVNNEIPLIGLVGRLADQKGWDLILPVLRWHLSENRPIQWIVLGSGDPRYEQELRDLREQFPGRFALHVGFSDELAHRIEASSDIFLMPSHYEPCGLNQLYSLRYGAVPVVTPTGGLADTVTDCDEQSIADGTATGFHIRRLDPNALDEAIGRALHIRYHQPSIWDQIVTTGMSQDWSWKKSAEQYTSLYAKTLALKTQPK
ncbi:MAG: glycogen synthase GlgA [Rubripirellula sp.]